MLYVIGQPPAKLGEAARESDVRTRHSLAACEALCSLAEELPELIADNESLLRTLFSATGGIPCAQRDISQPNYSTMSSECLLTAQDALA